MMYLLLSLPCWVLINSQNMWLLVSLKQHKPLDKPLPKKLISQNCFIDMGWGKKSLPLSKIKGKKSLSITMCLKLKEKITIPLSQKKLMIDDFEVIFELALLVSNIEREVCDVLKYFLFFLRKYEERKANNMVSLMLDLALFNNQVFFKWSKLIE